MKHGTEAADITLKCEAAAPGIGAEQGYKAEIRGGDTKQKCEAAV